MHIHRIRQLISSVAWTLLVGSMACRAELPADSGGVATSAADVQIADTAVVATDAPVAEVAAPDAGPSDAAAADLVSTDGDLGPDADAPGADEVGAQDATTSDDVQAVDAAEDLSAADTLDPDTQGPETQGPETQGAETQGSDTQAADTQAADTQADTSPDGSDTAVVAADAATGDTAGPVDCSDGVTCTVDELSAAGTCTHTAVDKLCDDGSLCTSDVCGKAGCAHENWTVDCDDGNPCTTSDKCGEGSCAGTPKSCDDKLACTDDSCDKASGCVFAPVKSKCDDGNLCTDDACLQGSGCVNLANAATCDDGDACTNADVCVDKACKTSKLSCDDGVACTLDSCSKLSGCAHVPQADACDDKNECTIDVCDKLGGCVTQDKPGGTPCNAGSACYSGMVCKSGTCSGGTAKCAPTAKTCFVTTCSEAAGCADIWATNGTGCSDGEACTSADSCSDGVCVGGPAPDCSSVIAGKGPCWLAVCTPGKGCQAVPAAKDTPCDDKQFCTKTDLCDGAGTCVGAGMPDLCTAGKSNDCGTFGCNSVTQVCTVSPKNTGVACTPDASACAKTGICVQNGACAPTDNTCAAFYPAATYPKEPLASGPQMGRLSDGRLGLAWLHSYEAGAAGDAAYVTRQAYFATIRADGLLGLPALLYDGKLDGHTMGSLQVLGGPDVDGAAGATVHMGIRSAGQQLCGPAGFAQQLQSKWVGVNAAMTVNALGSGSLAATSSCTLGDPSLWLTRQVRFGASGPVANHVLILENWTGGGSTWTLIDGSGAVVWSKPAPEPTAMAHDVVQVGDRYVLYASGTSASGLQLSVLDPAAGAPTVVGSLALTGNGVVALDAAIAAASPNKTTWVAAEVKTPFDRRLTTLQLDLSALPKLTGKGAADVALNLAGGPARPSIAGTDDGWGVAVWEDDLVIPNAATQRIVKVAGYNVKNGFAVARRLDSSILSGLAPRAAFAGAVVVSWVDGWYQSTYVTRVTPSASGMVTQENDLAAPALAAGTTTGHQTGPAVTATSDGKLRIGWALGPKAPISLVERTFDALGKPIDAAPRVLSSSSGGVLRLAALADGGWIAAWTEPEYDPGSGAVKSNHWKTQVFSKTDVPGAVLDLVALGVGQPYNPAVGTALAAIPGQSAAVLLSSGTTDTADTSDVLRVACVDGKGAPTGVVTISSDPGKSRAGLELRAVVTAAGQSQYWALWSESTAKLSTGKVEDVMVRVLDSQCQPLSPAAVLVAGTEAGSKSIRMSLPQLAGTQPGAMTLVWVRRDEGINLGTTLRMAPIGADLSLGEAATVAGPWTDPVPPVALRTAAGGLWIALRQTGLSAGSLLVTAPTKGAAATSFGLGKSQFAVALAEMAGGTPLLVYAQGQQKPLGMGTDSADVYLQVLPAK